jgi:hypothetical protein
MPIDRYFWQAIKVQKLRLFIQIKYRTNSSNWLNLRIFCENQVTRIIILGHALYRD